MTKVQRREASRQNIIFFDSFVYSLDSLDHFLLLQFLGQNMVTIKKRNLFYVLITLNSIHFQAYTVQTEWSVWEMVASHVNARGGSIECDLVSNICSSLSLIHSVGIARD